MIMKRTAGHGRTPPSPWPLGFELYRFFNKVDLTIYCFSDVILLVDFTTQENFVNIVG
jgi:hypothetical protein